MSLLIPQQQLRLHDWLCEHDELFVDVCRPKTAGSSTPYFIREVAEVEILIARETCHRILVTIFRATQFALRGVASDTLLSQALQQIPDGRSFRVVPLVYYPSSCDAFATGDSHKELREALSELSDEIVGIGPDPLDNDDPSAKVYTPPCEIMELSLARKMGAYVFAS